MTGAIAMPTPIEEEAPQQIFAPSVPATVEEHSVSHGQVQPAPAPPQPAAPLKPATPEPANQSEVKPEVKAEAKPVIKPEAKPEAKAEVKKVEAHVQKPEFVAPKPQPKEEELRPIPAAAEAMPSRADDLEDSISSIAQRVLEEKRQDQAHEAEGYMEEFNEKNADLLFGSNSRPLTMSERAEQKFKTEEGSPEKVKAQIDDAMDNPISHYFADKHPEVVENAQERHYLTDQV